MMQSTETQVAASTPGPASDRPPVGRFFMLFCALLALALGLAALSDAGAAGSVSPSAVGEARAKAAQGAPGG
jgi:hypothetical protein